MNLHSNLASTASRLVIGASPSRAARCERITCALSLCSRYILHCTLHYCAATRSHSCMCKCGTVRPSFHVQKHTRPVPACRLQTDALSSQLHTCVAFYTARLNFMRQCDKSRYVALAFFFFPPEITAAARKQGEKWRPAREADTTRPNDNRALAFMYATVSRPLATRLESPAMTPPIRSHLHYNLLQQHQQCHPHTKRHLPDPTPKQKPLYKSHPPPHRYRPLATLARAFGSRRFHVDHGQLFCV